MKLYIYNSFVPPLSGGVDLNSSSSGYARLGSGVAPSLGVVKGYNSSTAQIQPSFPLRGERENLEPREALGDRHV